MIFVTRMSNVLLRFFPIRRLQGSDFELVNPGRSSSSACSKFKTTQRIISVIKMIFVWRVCSVGQMFRNRCRTLSGFDNLTERGKLIKDVYLLDVVPT